MSVYAGFDFGVPLVLTPTAGNVAPMNIPLVIQALLKPLQNGCLEVEFYYAGSTTPITTTATQAQYTLNFPSTWGLPNTTVAMPGCVIPIARGVTGGIELISFVGSGTPNTLIVYWGLSATTGGLGAWRYKMLFSGQNKIVA